MTSTPKTLGELLVKCQVDLSVKRGHIVSDTEFAKWIGVSNYSFSQWKNDTRKPDGENLHRLAAKLGPDVYRLTGQPERMPDDPLLKFIAQSWHHLDEETKAKIEAIIRGNNNPINS